MKHLIKIFTLAAFFILFSSFCLNLHFVNQHGEVIPDTDFRRLPKLYRSFNTSYFQQRIEQIDTNYQADYKHLYQAMTDKATYLMRLNRAEEALDILRDLNIEYPDSYNIVINLGTAYELNGKPDSALVFIKKGLELNKDSHHGSEWFHVKVLEAKIALEQEPNWLNNHQVMNVDWQPILNIEDEYKRSQEMIKIFRDISYQLHERVPFTSTPDPLMANIFNEYGDLLADFSVEMAYVIYAIGKEYDINDSYGMKKKQKAMKRLIRKNKLTIPKVYDFFPHPSKYSLEPDSGHIENGPIIHHDLSQQRILRLIIITGSILLIILIGIIVGIVYLIKKWRRNRKYRNEK